MYIKCCMNKMKISKLRSDPDPITVHSSTQHLPYMVNRLISSSSCAQIL